MYSIIKAGNAKTFDLHAMEGLVRLFRIEGASHLCHCFYPDVTVPINQDFPICHFGQFSISSHRL